MSAHFKWYPGSTEVVVPWMAQYTFPSQANKTIKLTPRIPPKNGATFSPGNVIRLECPAQGYLVPGNTTMSFDVTLMGWGTAGTADIIRFQNGIASIFSRGRILYGSTPLEDVIGYNVINRNLIEWTGTGQVGIMDQSSMAQGIGGVVMGGAPSNTSGTIVYATVGATPVFTAYGLVNVRQFYIQGLDSNLHTTTTSTSSTNSNIANGMGNVPNNVVVTGVTNSAAAMTGSSGTSQVGACTRRYQINFLFGLFTQGKLLPLKFMASAFAIELTLENPDACIFNVTTNGAGATPTYAVGNVNLIPEMLEFDASYGKYFFVAIKNRCNVFAWTPRRWSSNPILVLAYVYLLC